LRINLKTFISYNNCVIHYGVLQRFKRSTTAVTFEYSGYNSIKSYLFLVVEIIQDIGLSDFEKKCEGAGHPTYHPKIIILLLILGMIEVKTV